MILGTRAVLLSGFRKLLGDPEGTSHAEYALILAIIGTAIVFGALWLSGTINPSFTDAATCISTSGTDCTHETLGRDFPDSHRPTR